MKYNDHILLGDFIYQLHKKEPFYGKSIAWSSPICVFSASTEKTIAQKIPKFIRDLKNKKILREDVDDLICVLGDWTEVAEGIFFTSKAIYVNSPKNQDKKFRVRYDDITSMTYYSAIKELGITDYNGDIYYVTTKLWNVHSIKLFLDYASGLSQYTAEEDKVIGSITLPHCDGKKARELFAGTVYSNVSGATTIYGEEKFHSSKGHGFAAERANTLYDLYTGHDASILGDDNALNGADRLVDGIQIQSKYCATGSRCISECFDGGTFRYLNPDGTPMQIEVPSDKDIYESAVKAMAQRIENGEVPGITDPKDAEKIVRKGHFTYIQAKNIAKAGTVESITYDAANGMIIASSTFGLTAVLTFATSIWEGENIDIALENAALNGLKVGGTAFLTSVLAGQLTKAGMNSLLVGSSDAIVKIMGPKASAVIANTLRSGKSIYGAAAMKNVSKLIRGNLITGTVSVLVLSAGDVANIFQKRISGPQLFKNFANTTSSVAGGSVGYIAGSIIGGPIIGGAIGALLGGSLAGKASNNVLGSFIEDDATKMVKIIEETFTVLASEYLLNQREVEHIVDHLGEELTGGTLKIMYASEDRRQFARTILKPLIDREIKRRAKISTPTIADMQTGLKLALESIADGNNND